MKFILVNYCFDPSWILDYTDDYLVLDKSDDGKDWCASLDQPKVLKRENRGNVDYDKLCYLVDNYFNLPEVFVWGKSNMFKYIEEEEFKKAVNKATYTPLLSKNHKTYSDRLGVVCRYNGEIYEERNDSWYLSVHPARYDSWGEWARDFFLPNPMFIPFPPGGNFILTREVVHKYSPDFYARMASTLPYCQLPGEAQLAERSYYLLWK